MSAMADRWWKGGSRGAPWDPWFRIGQLEVTTTVLVILLSAVSIVVYAVEPVDRPIMTRLAFWAAPVSGSEVWRLVTWPLSVLGFSIWTALTLLFFWWFGSDVERQLGRGRFAGLLVCSTVAMGLVAYAASRAFDQVEILTELQLLSLVLFFIYILEHPMGEFFFGIRMWMVGAAIAAINLIADVADRRWVHLSTLVVGTFITAVIAKAMGMLSLQPAIPTIPTPDLAARRRARDAKKRQRSRAHLSVVPESPPPAAAAAAPAVEDDLDPMDALLDKISESGMESLTPEERERLDELSRRRRER